MKVEEFNKAKLIQEDIDIQTQCSTRITNIYKANKNKNLTSEDIAWVIEYASISNTYIKNRLHSEFDKI